MNQQNQERIHKTCIKRINIANTIKVNENAFSEFPMPLNTVEMLPKILIKRR
jgi:hypothetical protein